MNETNRVIILKRNICFRLIEKNGHELLQAQPLYICLLHKKFILINRSLNTEKIVTQ